MATAQRCATNFSVLGIRSSSPARKRTGPDGTKIGSGNYSSMQVHNPGASQTHFTYNDWGSRTRGVRDLGIGNNDGGSNPDWSHAENANDWETRKL